VYCVSVIGLPGYQEVIIRISGYQGDPFLIPCILIPWFADLRSKLSHFLLVIWMGFLAVIFACWRFALACWLT